MEIGEQGKKELTERVEGKEDKETKEKLDVDGLVREANQKIQGAQDSLSKLPQSFQDHFGISVLNFFTGSIDAYATRDGKEGLTRQEFEEYRSGMLAKVEEITSGFKEGAEQARQEEGKKEKELRSAEEEAAQLDANLKNLGAEAKKLNAEALRNPENPDAVQAELQKYEERAQAMEQQRQVLGKQFQEALDVKKAYDKERSLSNAIAAGSTVGVGLAAGLSLIPGVNIGFWTAAGIGLAAYAIYKGATRHLEEQRVARLNETLIRFSTQFDARKGELAKATDAMNEDGTLLNYAPEALQKKYEGRNAEERGRIEGAAAEHAEQEGQARSRLAEIALSEAKLRGQRDLLTRRYADLERTRSEAVATKSKLKASELEENVHFVGEILASVEAARVIRPATDTARPAGGSLDSKKLEGLRSSRDTMVKKLLDLQKSEASVEEFLSGSAELSSDLEAGMGEVDLNLLLLSDASEDVGAALSTLSAQRLDLGKMSGEVDEALASQLEAIRSLDSEIGSGVLDVTVGNARALGEVEGQSKVLQGLRVEQPNMVASIWYGAFDGVGTLVKGIFDGAAKGLEYLGPPGRFLAGVSEGIGELGEGLTKITADVLSLGFSQRSQETLAGLGKLALGPLTENSRKAWGAVWDAMTAKELRNQGETAKASGKIALNAILTILPGVGAAKTAGTVGITAARLAQGGALAKTWAFVRAATPAAAVETGKLFTDGAKNVVRLPGAVVRGSWNALRGIGRPLVRAETKVAGLGSQLSAVDDAVRACKIGGRSLDEFAGSGKNLEQAATLNDPMAFMREAGLDANSGWRAIRDAYETRSLLRNRSKLKEDLAGARTKLDECRQAKASGTEGGSATATEATPGGPQGSVNEVASTGSEAAKGEAVAAADDLVRSAKESSSKVQELSKSMRELEDHGLLDGQSPKLKEYFEGKGSVTGKDIQVEIDRIDAFMRDASPDMKMRNLGTVMKYRGSLQSCLDAGRSLKSTREALANRLGFKPNQKIRVEGRHHGNSYPHEGAAYYYQGVDDTGRVMIHEWSGGGVGKEQMNVIRCRPENLRNFRKAEAAKPSAPESKVATGGEAPKVGAPGVETPIPKAAAATAEATSGSQSRWAVLNPKNWIPQRARNAAHRWFTKEGRAHAHMATYERRATRAGFKRGEDVRLPSEQGGVIEWQCADVRGENGRLVLRGPNGMRREVTVREFKKLQRQAARAENPGFIRRFLNRRAERRAAAERQLKQEAEQVGLEVETAVREAQAARPVEEGWVIDQMIGENYSSYWDGAPIRVRNSRTGEVQYVTIQNIHELNPRLSGMSHGNPVRVYAPRRAGEQPAVTLSEDGKAMVRAVQEVERRGAEGPVTLTPEREAALHAPEDTARLTPEREAALHAPEDTARLTPEREAALHAPEDTARLTPERARGLTHEGTPELTRREVGLGRGARRPEVRGGSLPFGLQEGDIIRLGKQGGKKERVLSLDRQGRIRVERVDGKGARVLSPETLQKRGFQKVSDGRGRTQPGQGGELPFGEGGRQRAA